MALLAVHLLGLDQSSTWTPEERAEWAVFCDHLQMGKDLERALGAVRLTDRQSTHVASGTREFLLPSDEAAFGRLLANRNALPLTRLYKYLFNSTHKSIDIVTPNYDRLAEYAADAGEFGHYTGFSHGYLQTRVKEMVKGSHGMDSMRHVCVWKVHGSLDWFRDAQNQIVGARVFREPPMGYAPLMITPGVDKYRLSHNEPFRTIFSCSDAALEKARSYLCVGYGFNDEHLQTKLIERCETYSVPIIVITKNLTQPAKAFLNGGRCRKYLALEEGPRFVRAYTNEAPTGIDLDCEPIWQLGKFLDFTIGDAA